MKNNKFIKATSIVMSAVVASMAMGSGACYAAQTKLDTAKKKLDEAKKRVESTTSRVVKDGRKFVNKVSNDVSNNVSNRDMSLLTAGFFTATAIVSGAAYYGYPNGLEDLAKHIVKVDVEEEEPAKLLALRLKGYNFGDSSKTADALLLISTGPEKILASAAAKPVAEETVIFGLDGGEIGGDPAKPSMLSRLKNWISQKAKPSYDVGELKVNKVYKATPEIESAFKQWMAASISQFEPGKVSGKLELVTIAASHVFSFYRGVQNNEFDKRFASTLISQIEDSARSIGNWPQFDNSLRAVASSVRESEEVGFGDDENNPLEFDLFEDSNAEKKEVTLVAYAARQIAADTGVGTKVKVTLDLKESAQEIELELANKAEKDIESKGEVHVKANVTEFLDNRNGTCNFTLDEVKFENVRFVKGEGVDDDT